jgi:hypothetical protein
VHFRPILQLVFLALIANGTPIFTKDMLGRQFSYPLDASLQFFDGKPVFGESKTLRGIVLAVIATSICARLLGVGWMIGVLVGITAMAGDLFSSFIKRRFGLDHGARATGLDQLPESLLPALACREALSLTILDIAAVCVLFFVSEILLSRILFRAHLRERPY